MFFSELEDVYSMINSMKTRRPVHTTSISRPAFTNDFDHSSDSSREGSVQIVESHRHTFSVPSSDDEVDPDDEENEVQIASSVHGDEEEISAATTPDSQAVRKAYNDTEGLPQGSKARAAPGETRGLNLKGPSLQDLLTKTAKDGTSQENPINLEGACTDIIDVDTESEDDGPEILPFHETSKTDGSNGSSVWDEPQVVCQTSGMKPPMTTTVAENENVRDSKTQRCSIVPETQVNGPRDDEEQEHNPTSIRAESTTGATDDFDTEDDDGFDYDDELFADEELDHFPYVKIPTSSKPKVTLQVGNEKPQYRTLTPPFDDFRPSRLDNLSVSDAIDVSQPIEPSSAWTQRTPSPSDAALARKASDPKTGLSRDIFDNFPVPKWPAPSKTAHSHSTEQVQDNTTLREGHVGAFSWPDLQSPEPRAYDQGPFSRQPKFVVPELRSSKSDDAKDHTRKVTFAWGDPHEDNDDFIMNADRFAGTGKQASKITIPSLVENYLAENPGSFKRKYGAMDENKDVEPASKAPKPSSPITRTSGYKRSFAEANPVISSYSLDDDLLGLKSQPSADPADIMWHSGAEDTTQRQVGLSEQDTPLPDAQPRENIFQSPTASTSQGSVSEPALGSVPVPTSVQSQDAEGPARKKARTSSSSSGGIGKFVMGVGFGLLGAAAAFVATIPASVYEEALREFGN